jgi:hypothetical protein
MPKGRIKNLKGAAELELNFSARRPIKWAAYEHSYPVPKPSGSPAATCPRPPAAGGRLDLPDTAPLRNQLEATHGCDWLPRRWVAGALLPGYGPALRCIFRQRARIVDAHIAIKNAVGTSSGQATPAVPPLASIIPPAAILRSLRLARFESALLTMGGGGADKPGVSAFGKQPSLARRAAW